METAHRVLFRLLLFFIFIINSVTADCPNNEVLVNCPTNCPYDRCPTRPRLPRTCPSPRSDLCRASACKCRFNYSRSKNGTCIPTRQCPPFRCTGPNEVYDSCPPYCPTDDCSQASPTGKCPLIGRIGIVVPCRPSCRCKKNYWRRNGICVPYALCNTSIPTQLQCSRENESLECVRDCPPEKTCKNKDIKFSCLQNNKKCQLKCVCKNNYYRNLNGECVTAEVCERCPGPNEYFSCGGACDNVCKDLDKQNQTNCPIRNIKCNDMCYCRDNYARNENNKCVPIKDCESSGARAVSHAHASSGTPTIYRNEEYQECKQTCPPDTCLSLVAKFKCESNLPCRSGHRCKPGYLRKKENEPCIPICQCPELANSPDCNNKLIPRL